MSAALVRAMVAMVAALVTVSWTAKANEIEQTIDAHHPSMPSFVSFAPSPVRHTHGAVLGYITPWNKQGYDVALNNLGHFTHLAPVWHQLKAETIKDDKITLKIHGLNDRSWLQSLNATKSSVKLVPRVIIEMQEQYWQKLIKSSKMQKLAIKRLTDLVTNYGYDGLTLEATELHAIARQMKNREQTVKSANDFLINLGKSLHSLAPRRELVLVVRPYFERSPFFGWEDLVVVSEAIDYFSLMTYDFSSGSEVPGPNAPLKWVYHSIYHLIGNNANNKQLTKKILVGLNFYGMKWTSTNGGKTMSAGEPIIGDEYQKIVARDSTVNYHWHDESSEMITLAENSLTIYYPTERSLALRIQLANEMGVGVSVWELGQGTPELTAQL